MGDKRADNANPENYDFENTKNLVVTGLYRYIRHPMYSSLLFLAWGAFLKHFTWYGLVAVMFASLFIYMTAKTEEQENIMYFGDAYLTYIKKSKMFFPYIF